MRGNKTKTLSLSLLPCVINSSFKRNIRISKYDLLFFPPPSIETRFFFRFFPQIFIVTKSSADFWSYLRLTTRLKPLGGSVSTHGVSRGVSNLFIRREWLSAQFITYFIDFAYNFTVQNAAHFHVSFLRRQRSTLWSVHDIRQKAHEIYQRINYSRMRYTQLPRNIRKPMISSENCRKM